MNLPCRFDHNLPCRGAVIGAFFYAGLSALMVHLSRHVPEIIFLVLSTLSVIFAALAIFMLIRGRVFPCILELTEDAILFPHGFPRTRISRIPYQDIIRMRPSFRPASTSFSLATARGTFEIMAVRFRDPAGYNAVKDLICSKSAITMTPLDKIASRDWRTQGFPEPICRWLEPADWPRYRTHLVVSKPLLPRLAKVVWFSARCLGVILFPWLLLQLIHLPTASISGYLWVAIPATSFFTLLYWLSAAYPVHVTEISVRERGITKFNGKQTGDWNYADFCGYEVVERPFEGRTLHILLLKRPKWSLEIALPGAAIREQLVRLLEDKKIPHSSDLKPSWESRS